MWTFRDITDRKETERTLRAALERDREAVERLRSLDEAKSLLLTAVSHELRTPLSTISGFARTLHDRGAELTPEQQHDFLERLLSGAQRLEYLVLNLFDLDRISRGVLEPQRQETDLVALVRRVVDEADIASRSVEVEASPATALIDPGMIERVVENLLVNAVKHTPSGTTITVWVGASDGTAVIAVEDQGPGVPEGLRDAIFEPFRQGDVPSHSPGTGVGLALVSRFTEVHGGRAWVDERAGGGASFRVSLPCRPPAPDDPSPEVDLREHSPIPAAEGRIEERRPVTSRRSS